MSEQCAEKPPGSDDGLRASRHIGLRERSLPHSTEASVVLHGVPRSVPVGTKVRALFPDRMLGRLVVAALMDQKAVSLTTRITASCNLAPLTTQHWEGQRIHRQSVALLAIEAGQRLEPPVRLRMGPSLGFAQRVSFFDPAGRGTAVLAAQLEEAMRALAAEHPELHEEWWTVDEARAHFRNEGASAAALLDTWRDPAVPLASYGRVHVLQMGPLVPDAGLLEGFHVLPGDEVLLLAYGTEGAARPLTSSAFPMPFAPSSLPLPGPSIGSESSSVGPKDEPDAAYVARHARRASTHVASLIEGQERWLAALEVSNVGALNHLCVSGGVAQLIRVSEGFHEKRIGAIADEIRDRREDVRVICIAGPSSSGKTTFIQRLEVQLEVDGLRPIGLSLDDYYCDRERTPRDGAGEYDYEALEALQLDLLGDHLRRLLDGETVRTARFDFQTGISSPQGGKEMKLGKSHVLLLEGIHCLNPSLLRTVPAERVYRVFCCPLAQLPFDDLTRVHASDVRLIRRIVRDRHSRGTQAADGIQRWPSVRAGERRHIFPFQHHADAVFDSSLVYEMNVMRVFAERYLLEVPHDHPSYTTAFRLLRLLDRFVAIYPDHVPPTSIVREFIGGSGFRY